MYNEYLKQSFIEEKENVIAPEGFFKRIFEKSEKLEEELKKDISDFTTNEIITFYKILNMSSLNGIMTINSALSQYTQTCLENNLVKDHQNHFQEMTIDLLNNTLNKKIIEKSIISRTNLINLCGTLINVRDRFIILSLFEGIKGKDFCEIVNIKLEDINGNEANLCTGRTVKISDLLKEYAIGCKEQTTYYSNTNKMQKFVKLKDRGYIIKDYPNVDDNTDDFYRGRNLYNSLRRCLIILGVDQYISANTIYDSGKIHMIKQEAKKLNMDPEEYIYSIHFKDIEEQYGQKIEKKKFITKYKEQLQK